LDFNKDFGLRLSDRISKRFLFFFSFCLLIVFSQILFLANMDYSTYSEKYQTQIIENYKQYVVELITEYGQQITKTDTAISESYFPVIAAVPTSITPVNERQSKRKATDAVMGKEGILNPKLKSDPSTGLPEIEAIGAGLQPDEFVVVELSRKGANSGMRFQKRAEHKTNYSINIHDESLDELYNYVIHRQGNAYINPTEELLLRDNQIEFGYRDPDEIQRVIAKYKPMIEHCYRKALNQYGGSSGFVKVQFQISYEGYVISESIRILNSTIKNRPAEQCIKKYIKRWRNFARLDETMGIARVTQKFVFN